VVVFGGGSNDRAEEHAETPQVQSAALTNEQSKTVTIEFESSPAGAEVFDAPDGEPIGTTPLTKTFDRADEPQVFFLKKTGFLPSKTNVSLRRDNHIAVTLSPTADPAETAEADSAEEGAEEPSPETQAAAPRGETPRRADRVERPRHQGSAARSSEPSRPTKIPAASSTNGDRRAVIDPFAN
jgi:hypothetical protein